ncbi:MAG: Ig-like domain-containing protein [Rikenellaceae bacterium]|jgi:uncharacterized protein YjdB|nr:Ig-like domain-containing protein [Rikenellaceae bacterium]
MKDIAKMAAIMVVAAIIGFSCGKNESEKQQRSMVTGVQITNLIGEAIILGGNEPITKQVTVAVTPSDAVDIDRFHFNYHSSDNRIFTVNEAGLLTCVGAGEATLTVVARNNASIKTSCKVKAIGVLVSSINIAAGSETVSLTVTPSGVTFATKPKLTIVPADASVKELTFVSNDPNIARVDPATGVITAVWEGSTTVRAEATDGSGKFAEFAVNVSVVRATSATLNASATAVNIEMPSTFTLSVGTATSSMIQLQPNDVSTLKMTFVSDDPTIATVNDAGVITGLNSGSTTVTATTTDGSNLSTTTTVNVTKYLYTPIDRTGWTLTSSPLDSTLVSNGFSNNLSAITDAPTLATGVAFMKTGNTNVPSGGAWLLIDMGSPKEFNYFQLTHKLDYNYNGYLVYCLVAGVDFSGSDDDVTYTPIQNVTGLASIGGYNGTGVELRKFSASHTYRYVRGVLSPTFMNYPALGLTSMAVCDLQLGLYTLVP